MKIINFRGDLTDNSAEKEALMISCFMVCDGFRWTCSHVQTLPECWGHVATLYNTSSLIWWKRLAIVRACKLLCFILFFSILLQCPGDRHPSWDVGGCTECGGAEVRVVRNASCILRSYRWCALQMFSSLLVRVIGTIVTQRAEIKPLKKTSTPKAPLNRITGWSHTESQLLWRSISMLVITSLTVIQF